MKSSIGRITSVSFGLGGYNEAEIVMSLTISFKGSGVTATVSGGWADNVPTAHAKWTKESTYKTRSEMLDKIIESLKLAQVDDIQGLNGRLVSCDFDFNVLKDWRILTEEEL